MFLKKINVFYLNGFYSNVLETEMVRVFQIIWCWVAPYTMYVRHLTDATDAMPAHRWPTLLECLVYFTNTQGT